MLRVTIGEDDQLMRVSWRAHRRIDDAVLAWSTKHPAFRTLRYPEIFSSGTRVVDVYNRDLKAQLEKGQRHREGAER